MKRLPLLLLLALAACADDQPNPKAKVFKGDFAGSPLTLQLVQLDDSAVEGRSEHKGKSFEMSGKRRPSEKGYVYSLSEVGQGRFAGSYEFEMDTALHLVFGSWISKDTGSRMGVLFTLEQVSK